MTTKNPRPGSRTYLLAHMKVGDSVIIESTTPGRMSATMSQIQVDATRAGITIMQSKIIGVHMESRRVLDLVRVERLA